MMRELIARRASDSLAFAAAPAFALMALLTALLSDGHTTGMVPMYLLMTLFHLPPWLRLAATRQG